MSDSELSPAYILRLPPELHDRIIDYLHTDPTALGACSLTCGRFLPAARFYRFRHWRLQLSPNNSAHFQQLLSSPHATLGKYIDYILLQYNTGDRRWQEDVAAILPALPHASKLRLYATDLAPSIALGTVIVTPSFAHLVAIITAFPNLRTLALIGAANGRPSEADDVPDPALPTLTAPLDELRFTDKFQYLLPFIRWAAAQGLLARLRALTFSHGLSHSDKDAAQELFAALGPALEHLTIINAVVADMLPFALARCTCLRSLTFARLSFPSVLPEPWSWALPELLAQIKTHSVEHVAISLTYAHPNLLAYLGWVAELEGPLSRPEFDGLKELRFEVPVVQLRGRESAFEKAIRSQIPVLDARGVVVVQFFQQNESYYPQ
ncbi:hypothetical protein B0H21DRAFT_894040 [Amylocystis lapponica]|nr:hypothetical protein B0H21DRAFT_894040 [Amylocystis lapponica]